MLRRHQVWMSIHFMHPDELTPEVEQACDRLADAGIPLGSQTVLIRGVNDDVETMKQLMHGLLSSACGPTTSTSATRSRARRTCARRSRRGSSIIAGLRGHTTGYAVPTFVVDAPGGGGKIPLLPDTIVGRDGDFLLLRNYAGEVSAYPDLPPRREDE